MTITARVQGGRLVVDEPTTLLEGTEVPLLPLDPGDWLDDSDRQALHAALRASDSDVAAGRLLDAKELLRGLGRVVRPPDSLHSHSQVGDANCYAVRAASD